MAQVVELLIQRGATPDFRDELTGMTPLLWACYWGHAAVVHELIRGGADHTAVDSMNRGPKQVASSRSHRKVVEVIKLKEADLRVHSRSAPSPSTAQHRTAAQVWPTLAPLMACPPQLPRVSLPVCAARFLIGGYFAGTIDCTSWLTR